MHYHPSTTRINAVMLPKAGAVQVFLCHMAGLLG